jgi:UDP-GlcNAc:undecaprenyl-phosphate/decaprenyl-phosphate GlcNAc-1-phosphate transferase
MYSLLMLAVTSFCAAFVLTPLCRNLAIRWGMVDQPDHVRKFHTRAIPRVGGISIFIACLVSFTLLLLSPLTAGNLIRGHFDVVRNLFPAATIVFFTGLLDDLLGLKAWQKFAGQFAASAVAVWAGVQISGIAGHHFPSWCVIPVSVLWLVGCTNAFNLIDGVDGLAAGVGLLATTTTLVAALLQHNIGLAIATVPLAGALLGVMRFNYNPASIFLGDSGSLFIGFLLGCYGVLWSQKSATVLGMTAPLIALSIPLLDTGVAIIRRFLRRQPIFGADHGHIHHQLLARGLTPRRVVILIYIVCGFCAGLSLLQSFAHERFGGPIIILFCAGAWIGVQRLGYAEFEMARRLVLAGNFRRHLNAELQLGTFREDLAAAVTPDQCWEILQHTYYEFGFYEIRFKLGDRLYTHTTNGHHVPNTWTVRIQFSENDYLNLSREFDTEAPPIVARFTDAVGKILCPKTSEMLRTDPIHPDIAITVGQVQPANGVEKPLEPITAMMRNPSSGSIMPSKQDQPCQD